MNKTVWLDLMARLSNIKRMDESYQEKECVNIRHDIDDNLPRAVKMASEEYKLGIVSTYFFLNTARYWEDKNKLTAAICLIKSMGHEIGWHNNAISDHLTSEKSLKSCILDPLAELRKWANVVGTASHGDPLCHKHGYLNYYIFSVSKKHPVFPYRAWGDIFELSDFGLSYEAYHIGGTHYLSDAGGEFNVSPEEIIKKHKQEGGKLIINLHSQYWDL